MIHISFRVGVRHGERLVKDSVHPFETNAQLIYSACQFRSLYDVSSNVSQRSSIPW